VSGDKLVYGDEFREWMAPTILAVNTLVRGVEDIQSEHGALPAADSRAMAELAAEDEYSSRSGWEIPLADTHAMGGFTLRAAADYARSFAAVFSADHPPNLRASCSGA
jgi:hypothetical protein